MEFEIRVAWGDMDAYGHVNNAVFLRWFESARIEWFELVAFPEEDGKSGPILRKATVEYLSPIKYPDTVRVTVVPSRIGRTSVTLAYEVTSLAQEAIVATGETVVVLADFVGRSSLEIPPDARSRIESKQLRVDPLAVPPCKPPETAGTVSKSSWGETSGIYPTKANLYDPSKWDQIKECEVRRMRAAIHDVCKRNPQHHENSPNMNDPTERKLAPYHMVENFPPLDAEITSEVEWFYLSNKAVVAHPGTTGTTCVKTYGPFFNNGGGDVPRGDVYVHFYKLA